MQLTRGIILSSQKHTKIDTRYFLGGSFWISLGQFTSLFISFLTSIVFANYLTKTTYGSYQFLINIIGLLSIFSLSGLSVAVTQAVAKNKTGTLSLAVKEQLLWSIPGSLIALLAAIYYFGQTNFLFAAIFLFTAITFPVLNALNLYDAYLAGKEQFQKSTTFSMLQTIVLNAILISMAIVAKNHFLEVLILYPIIQMVTSGYCYYTVRKNLPTNDRIDRSTLTLGKHLSAVNIVNVIADRIDSIALFAFLGPAALATYTFAVAVPEQVKGLFKSIGVLALPRFSKYPMAEIRRNLHRHLVLLSAVAISLSIFYILLSPLMFHLLFPKYPDAIFYSQIFALSFLTFPMLIFPPIFQAKKQTRKLYLHQIVTSTLQIITVIIGAYYFGLMGVILSRIFVRIVNYTLGYYLVNS